MNRKLAAYWSGKSVLVTGASSGLGWVIVEALAPYRIHFCLLSRREERMKELVLKLKDSGSVFWIKTCDVRNRDEVLIAVQEFHNQNGCIDIAWVNSGVGVNSSFKHWNWDKIEAAIDTNLKGAIYTIRACLEVMVPQNAGAIIAIGSAASMRGLPTRGIYSLTKVSVEYFLESLAAEFPEIQFTMIHPGFVNTPILQSSSNRLWLMSPEKAAQIMIKAVAKRKKMLVYPFRMNLLFRFARMLPTSIYLKIARKTIALHRKQDHQSSSGSL